MDEANYRELTGHLLQDSRDNWRTLCPVHDETTPSFFIHKDTFQAHCFGCGESGYLENVLARAGYGTARDIRTKLDIPLLKKLAKDARPEVDNFSKAWLAGYRLIRTHPFLERRGFSEEVIVSQETRWDAQDKRVVFPLKDPDGKVVGAVGRTVANDPRKWKFYWHAAKAGILYRDRYSENVKQLIVVEGIFEVMWLLQAGYSNIAAILGSHPTKKQVELIKNATDSVVLFLDNDKAGQLGQEKLRSALKGSVEIKYALYPRSVSDPQELTVEEINTAFLTEKTHIEYVNTA